MKNLLEWINIFSKSQVSDWSKAKPVHPKARGIPLPKLDKDCKTCQDCVTLCPTKAIDKLSETQLAFDYGACIQCGECVAFCPEGNLENSGFNYVFSRSRKALQITFDSGRFTPEPEPPFSKPDLEFQALTAKSGFLYREVAAGGNNSVECELNASFNSVFDSEREGIRSVASPKHADVLLFSGPISPKMEIPIETAWEVMPEPKALIACGTEAISGGLYPQGKCPTVPNLFIAGDPPRPDVVLQAFRYFLGRFSFSFQSALANWRQG